MNEDIIGRLMKTMDKMVDRIIKLENVQRKLVDLTILETKSEDKK